MRIVCTDRQGMEAIQAVIGKPRAVCRGSAWRHICLAEYDSVVEGVIVKIRQVGVEASVDGLRSVACHRGAIRSVGGHSQMLVASRLMDCVGCLEALSWRVC